MKISYFFAVLFLCAAAQVQAAPDEAPAARGRDKANFTEAVAEMAKEFKSTFKKIAAMPYSYVSYGRYADQGAYLTKSPAQLALAKASPSLFTFERSGEEFGFGFMYQLGDFRYIVGCRHHFVKTEEERATAPSSFAPFEAVTLTGERYPARLAALEERTGLALVEVETENSLPALKGGPRAHPYHGRDIIIIGKPAPVQPVVMTHETITIRLAGTPLKEPMLAVGSLLFRNDSKVPGPGCKPQPEDILKCCPDVLEYGSKEVRPGFGGGPVLNTKSEVIGVHMAHGSYEIPAGFATGIDAVNMLVMQTGFGGSLDSFDRMAGFEPQ